jgi:ribosomal protein L9
MQDISASLDRLNPSLGYIEGNVVVISMKANAIKNAYGAQDIARVAEWLEEQGYN